MIRKSLLAAACLLLSAVPAALAGETRPGSLEIPVPAGLVKVVNGAVSTGHGPVPSKLAALLQKKPNYVFAAILPKAFGTGTFDVLMLVDELEKGKVAVEFNDMAARKTLEHLKAQVPVGEKLLKGEVFLLPALKGVLTVTEGSSNRKYQYTLQPKEGPAYIVTFAVKNGLVREWDGAILEAMGTAIGIAGSGEDQGK